MSTYYLDYVSGSDSYTETPLGWWSCTFDTGDGTEPIAAEEGTGGTSSETISLTIAPDNDSGTWVGGDATGTMYFYGKSGDFTINETVTFDSSTCRFTSDPAYCAWRTFTAGPTAARIAIGDTTCIAKSNAAASIGNGTWTDGSKYVVLASAQTLDVEMCEGVWTADGSGDISAITAYAGDRKEGSYSMQFQCDSVTQTSIRQAYKSLPSQVDLSSYQKISFWIKDSGAISEDNWLIKLCSDENGVTAVDEFEIPAIPFYNKWVPITLARKAGGNLGSTINSIALYSGTAAPLASKYVYLDCIIACTTDGLNLQSLISKNSNDGDENEGWSTIKNISGVNIHLDNHAECEDDEGVGYSGTTELITTYKRETIKTDFVEDEADTTMNIEEGGASGTVNMVHYLGGYDPATNLQDGDTHFDGLSTHDYGLKIYTQNYVTISNMSFYRYLYGLHIQNSHDVTIDTLRNLCNNYYGIYFNNSVNCKINNAYNLNRNNYPGIRFYNNTCNTQIGNIYNINNNIQGGISYSTTNSNNKFDYIKAIGNVGYGINFNGESGNIIKELITSGSTGNAAVYSKGGYNYIQSSSIAETSEANIGADYADARIYIDNIGDGTSKIISDGINVITQTANDGGTGIECKLSITSNNRLEENSFLLNVARIAVLADKLVTVKMYFKKSNGTVDNINAYLLCEGGQILGVASDVESEAPDDTNRNQVTISFTPTAIGVIDIKCKLFGSTGMNLIIDDITITQAD